MKIYRLFPLICGFALLLSGNARAVEPLNVVLFLIDDLGWKDLGCQGSNWYRTPHIDQLAEEGVRFTHAYSTAAICTPTRASVLTGKYPARLLMTQWTPAGRWDREKHAMQEGRFLRALPLEEITLAEALREEGYRTGHIGKWHLGGQPFSLPEHHGFDVNVAGQSHGAPGSHFHPYTGDWEIPTTGLPSTKVTLPDGEPGEYLTDRLTDEALTFIEDSRDQPFFLHFAHYAVHTPLQAKEEMIAHYEATPKEDRQGHPSYAAMVESVDESVGRVMQKLEELELADRTLIIFTSDNGGFARATDHAPLRANKGSHYEGGIRVPLIIRWPGVTEEKRVVRIPAISTDFYPTILEAALLPPLPHQHMDGLSLVPILKQTEEVDALTNRALFWHYPHYNRHPFSFPAGIVRKGPWKLIWNYETDERELYHLKEDPGESSNVIADNPERAERLSRMLGRWLAETDADLMQPNPYLQ